MKKWISLLLVISIFGLTALPGYAERGKFVNNSDPQLLSYIKSELYQKLVSSLNSDDYFVENVEAIYLSEEYFEELEFNSRSNIFFGYNIDELDAQFQGEKYFFTLQDNHTVVKKYEPKDNNDSYYTAMKNMAVGTGIILICVTVSVVSGGVGAPAISMIFSVAAKTGTIAAVSGGILGGVSAGIVTGFQTGDINEALKAAALSGSDGFKWGAITGALSGGIGEGIALKGATLNGLTMNEAALIQKESKYPLDVIKQFQNMDQYKVAKEAGLRPYLVDNKVALIRDIDLNYVDEMGRNNLQRMKDGLAALDPATGSPYELHHIGQKMDSTLAILTRAEHTQNGNDAIWHTIEGASQINRNVFNKQRASFWKEMASILGGGN